MNETKNTSAFNGRYIESVLFKEMSTNPTVMSVVHNKLEPEVFTNEVFKRAANVYRLFWSKYTRLPNKEDLKMFTSNEAVSKVLVEARNICSQVDSELVEKESMDTFYELAETYIRKRRGELVLNRIISDYNNGRLDSDKAVTAFSEVSSIKLIQDLGFDIYENLPDFINNSYEDGNRLSTGFPDIDQKIGGGLPATGKFLGVVSAPTNMGKSIFLGNLAVNAAKQGKSVLIITLEMSQQVYAGRIYSSLYNIPIAEIPFRGEELKAAVDNAKYGQMLIKEFPPGTMTVEEISGYIDNAINEGRHFDIICVDYLTLLSAPGADNSNEAGKIIARKLRALSYKYSIPVFTAAQINRDGFGLTPDMKYMAESIAICSESDLIVSLYRQEEDVELSIMRLWFLKNRLGERDVSTRLFFNTPCLRFETLPEDLQGKTADDESTAKAVEAVEIQSKLNEILDLTVPGVPNR